MCVHGHSCFRFAVATFDCLHLIPLTRRCLFSFHLQELFATALDFLKLEKVELGGSRGKILSEMVFSMSEEFHDHWRALRESKYDPLDYTDDVRPN